MAGVVQWMCVWCIGDHRCGCSGDSRGWCCAVGTVAVCVVQWGSPWWVLWCSGDHHIVYGIPRYSTISVSVLFFSKVMVDGFWSSIAPVLTFWPVS